MVSRRTARGRRTRGRRGAILELRQNHRRRGDVDRQAELVSPPDIDRVGLGVGRGRQRDGADPFERLEPVVDLGGSRGRDRDVFDHVLAVFVEAGDGDRHGHDGRAVSHGREHIPRNVELPVVHRLSTPDGSVTI